MEFWRENKIAKKFTAEPEEVAEEFAAMIRRARFRVIQDPENAKTEMDWLLKLDGWPLERTLRNWLTADDGYNSTWEDEAGFRDILWLASAKIRNSEGSD